MNDKKSKIISLSEYLKSRDAAELQQERRCIQTEHLYKPPAPKKSSTGGMRPASLLEKWLMTLPTVVPPGLADEEQALLQLWLKHLYLSVSN